MTIDADAIETLDPGPEPELDRARHYMDGPPEDVADYFLTLDSINFGSGWFPVLKKRAGLSGYRSIAIACRESVEAGDPWSGAWLRGTTAAPSATPC